VCAVLFNTPSQYPIFVRAGTIGVSIFILCYFCYHGAMPVVVVEAMVRVLDVS
jgi:hypothetical protein